MQIVRLRLSGFKSFVHPTDLVIEPGLTGIVGPNGCGKSNVVEALRWVMGESSARGLRGGEMDDVIFAGTATRPPFDLAEVSLQMRGVDPGLVGLDEVDELEVCRRIGRGMGSMFRVNGRELRARDVQLLFTDGAVGARSAAIVNQGQIGALVEAKPSDRRRLLEEAAGIGGLQARRHEAELKLQAADANLSRLHDLLVTLEEQHGHLRKQAQQAARYRKLSAAWREAEAGLLVGRWQVARAASAEAELAVRTAREQIDSRGERLSAARAARDRAAAALPGLRDAEAMLAAELARLNERLATLDQETARAEGARARLVEHQQQTAQDLTHARAALDDARAMRERLDQERTALESTAEQDAGALDRAAAAEAVARQELEDADARLREAVTSCAGIEAELRQLTERRDHDARRRQALVEAQAEARTQLATLGVPEDEGGLGGSIREAEDLLTRAGADQEVAEEALRAAEQCREGARAGLSQAEQRRQHRQEQLRVHQERAGRAEQARRALAERQDELRQRTARLAERARELADKSERCSARRAALELAELEDRSRTAQESLEQTEAQLGEAHRKLDATRVTEQAQRQAEHERRAACQRLEAELAALAELTDPAASGGAVIELIEATDGYAEALAAALGDDLMGALDPAAPIHWQGVVGPDVAGTSPALPDGVPPLARFVSAPAALARRLCQVGVVEPARAAELQAALAQGQRLVSRDGGLWRWDGFVRQPDAGDAAAARLRQQTRRRQLGAELAEQQAQLAARQRERAEAEAAHAAATTHLTNVEGAREAARQVLEAARARLADGRAADAALAAELATLGEEQARLDAERVELERGADALADQHAGLAPPEASDGELAALQTALAEAEAEHATFQAALQEAEAAHAAARPGVTAARDRLSSARATLDQRQADARVAEGARQEQRLLRVTIEGKLARLDEELAALDAAAAQTDGALPEVEARLAAARDRVGRAETRLAEGRHRLAETNTRHTRERDRQAGAAARRAALADELGLWSERAQAAEAQVTALSERQAALADELTRITAEPEALRAQHTELKAAIAEAESRRRALQHELETGEATLAEAQKALDRAETERFDAREATARLEGRLERAQAEYQAAEAALRSRFGQLPADPLQPPPDAARLAELEAELARLGAARDRLGPVNLRAIDEAEELAQKLGNLQAEAAELTDAIERLRRAIAALNREGRERLRAAFARVEEHFEALFVRLFGGGRARLSLTDLEDPLAAGLELAASPPGKKLQSVSLLSGGEKALTALALIFAVFLTRPAPLCVLDEVDAPLDDANVERLGDLLEELAASTDTRFIMITHHPLTMARMDRLYGVTMVERGISQLVSVDLRRAVELRASA